MIDASFQAETGEPASEISTNDHTSDRPLRVLLAEDSPITRDVLKLLLTNRGHVVDLAEDGEQAFAALQQNDYDVVLMDFHLPKMDGLEVTAAHRAAVGTKKSPRFIAITADVNGLLAHAGNCETFDDILPKPFDIDDICRVLDKSGAPQGSGEAEGDAESAAPAAIARSGSAFLRWPADLTAQRLQARDVQAGLASGFYDAVLIDEPATAEDLMALWDTRGLHVLPIIDLAGGLGTRADLDASKRAHGQTDSRDRLIQTFRDRRRRLHREVLMSEDLAHKLIGRMFAAGVALTPVYDPSTREHFSYNALLDTTSAMRETARLQESGLLRATFFDRFPVCSHCQSARQTVREQCAKCRSANLTEEIFLHHFRCAYQGAEEEFRRGHDLVCPKCSRELLHLGADYDRPGSMMKCLSCGHAVSDAVVAFTCLDCGAQFDASDMVMRNAFSYALTERGYSFAESGRTLLGERREPLRLVELPLELILLLNGELKAYQASRTPFALLDITYRTPEETNETTPVGPVRGAFLATVQSAIGAGGSVVKGRSRDFALVRGLSPQQARERFAYLARGDGGRTASLGASLDIFGPEDFA